RAVVPNASRTTAGRLPSSPGRFISSEPALLLDATNDLRELARRRSNAIDVVLSSSPTTSRVTTSHASQAGRIAICFGGTRATASAGRRARRGLGPGTSKAPTASPAWGGAAGKRALVSWQRAAG